MSDPLHPVVTLAAAPLFGRLAFAGVFLLLIGWLLWIPADRLQTDVAPDSAGDFPNRAPSTIIIRLTAVVIAAIQALLYLFWS